MSDSPGSQPAFLQPSAAAGSSAAAEITVPVYLEPSATAASSASATVTAAPLVHVATASVYASGGASQVIITQHPESPLPDVDISLSENVWDLTTTGFGVGVGAVIGHVPGAAVGGFAMYAWGRLRWRQAHRSDP